MTWAPGLNTLPRVVRRFPSDSYHTLKQKKKLLYILHDIAIGGVEVALLSAIPDLYKAYDLKVIVLGKIDPKNVGRLSEEEMQAFKVFDYPIYAFVLKIPSIVKYILNFGPDMMICSLWRASMLACIVKKASPKIRLYAFNHSTRFSHKLQGIFIRMASRMANVVLTDSIATSNFVRTFDVKAPVYEVSFLTDPSPAYAERCAPQPGMPVRFMFLGRINPVKNLPMIIEAIQILRTNGVNAMLDIYGRNDGNIQESEALIKKFDLGAHVHFKGEVESSKRKLLFSQYHFYIQLSAWEGMAMSVAEAMQHGLVCVVSPVGEIVHYSKDMETAVFIDIYGPDWRSDLQKVIAVVDDGTKYQQISQGCRLAFVNKKRYSESLIERLEQ